MKKIFYALSLFSFFVFNQAKSQELTHYSKISAYGGNNVILDRELLSPKSALFSNDGSKLYINALEAGKTLVYSFPELKKVKTISHTFNSRNEDLFLNQSTVFNYPLANEQRNLNVNHFMGKPVEMVLSHNGRYLWVTYYRRTNDPRSAGPSALALIDTSNDEIIRVFPTGPLPKFVTVSPNSASVLVVHWGDNTIMQLDTSSSDYRKWFASNHLSVEKKMDLTNISGDRDKNCGFCLRGTVFSRDGKTIFVSRMGGGGIAGFDAISGNYLGTVTSVASTPRHLVMSKDGSSLFVTSNVSGIFSEFNTDELTNALINANGKRVGGVSSKQIKVGSGARTIDISPDENFAYIATNLSKEIVTVDLNSFTITQRISASPFPVGLAVSPDGCFVVSTSQGRVGQGGGNTVDIFKNKSCN